VAHQFTSTPVAILISFAVSALVFVRNSGHGIIRALSVLSFTIVSLAAVTGIVRHSDSAFVAQNLVGDFSIALVSVGSVAIRRPLVGAIARDVAPGIQPVMPIGHPTFVALTLLNAAMSIASGVARIAMFEILSTDLYVIFSRVPVAGAGLVPVVLLSPGHAGRDSHLAGRHAATDRMDWSHE
jgi:hypothetical protein